MSKESLHVFFKHVASREQSHGHHDAFRFKNVLNSRKKGSLVPARYAVDDDPDADPDPDADNIPTNRKKDRRKRKSNRNKIHSLKKKSLSLSSSSSSTGNEDGNEEGNNELEENISSNIPDYGLLSPAPTQESEDINKTQRKSSRVKKKAGLVR
jgi:hypothetical protein